MTHHQANQTAAPESIPPSTPTITQLIAVASAAVIGTALAIAVGGPRVLRLMIGSRIEAIDNTGQWLLFTAWDIEHAAQTAPWPIQTLALTIGLAATIYIVSPKRLRPGGCTTRRTGGQGIGR